MDQYDYKDEHHKLWYTMFYKFMINHIEKRSLHYLYPGWGNTDVALAMVGLWNSYPNPDDIAVEEMYDLFLQKTRRKRFFLTPIHLFFEKLNYLTRTACDERCLFLDNSRIRDVRPDFRLPSSLGKRFWRGLYKDLFRVHQQKLKKTLGRTPYLYELVADWYDNVWLPGSEY